MIIRTYSSIFFIGTALIFNACSNTIPQVKPLPVKIEEANATKVVTPPPPQKHIELKEVQDDNYSPEYMYPEDTDKKERFTESKSEDTAHTSIEKASADMSKEECISMIGEEKFDKYTKMFGNEAASIKRCTLLKSMQKS